MRPLWKGSFYGTLTRKSRYQQSYLEAMSWRRCIHQFRHCLLTLWSLPMLFPRLQYPLHHPSDQQPVTNGDLSVCDYTDLLPAIILFNVGTTLQYNTDKPVALPQITIESNFQIYLHSTRTFSRIRFHDLSTLLSWSLEQASPYARFYREFPAAKLWNAS